MDELHPKLPFRGPDDNRLVDRDREEMNGQQEV
jgi:hypothetical protein